MNLLLLSWNSEVGMSEIIAGLTFLAVVIGGIFALCQWRVSIKQKRADYLNSLLERKNSFHNTFYLFDYDCEWYTSDFHNGGKWEYDVDGALDYLSYVCFLKKEKLINEQEFLFLKYNIKRIIKNRQVIDYLHNLYCFSEKNEVEMPFSSLLEYAIDNNLIGDIIDFKNPKSTTYHRYLNY